MHHCFKEVLITVVLCFLLLESRIYMVSLSNANLTGFPRVRMAGFDQGKNRCSLATYMVLPLWMVKSW